MFRQVLVPVKFSVCGRLAAWHACDVVRAIGGTVTLLHVLEYSASGHLDLEAAEADEAQDTEARYQEARYQEARHQEALALLRQLGLYARRPPRLLIVRALDTLVLDSSALGTLILNVPAPSGSALDGSALDGSSLYGSAPGGVASAILEVAAETGAELIMLGLHSQGGPVRGMRAQGMLGRVVGPVLLGAGVPVQVTPCRPDTGIATGARSAGWRSVLAGQD